MLYESFLFNKSSKISSIGLSEIIGGTAFILTILFLTENLKPIESTTSFISDKIISCFFVNSISIGKTNF